MRAEFSRMDGDQETLVGVARLVGARVEVDSENDQPATDAIRRIFRLTPVVVDDASLRPLGARGEVVLEPGDQAWFEAAALQRAEQEGLTVRLVPEAVGHGGWDPASAYRTFRQTVQRLLSSPEPEDEPQPGEARPEALPEAQH